LTIATKKLAAGVSRFTQQDLHKKPGFFEKSSLFSRDIDAETGFLTPRA